MWLLFLSLFLYLRFSQLFLASLILIVLYSGDNVAMYVNSKNWLTWFLKCPSIHSFNRHSSSTLFDCTSFGHHRDNTMEFLTFFWSCDGWNRWLYVHETSAHVPGSTCGTGTWVLWCMDEVDVDLDEHDKCFLLHRAANIYVNIYATSQFLP